MTISGVWRRRDVAWWIGISTVILAGVWIRVVIGLNRPGLWADEVDWFTRFSTTQELELSIRAPGYLLLHQVLFQDVFSTVTELRIRIVSVISGVLFLPLFTLVVYRLFRSAWLTLIGALLSSFNVALASFTHEFKPYMVDLFLHTAWFYAAILVEDKRRAAYVGTSVLIVACLFSYSAVPLLGFQFVYLVYLHGTRKIGRVPFVASGAMVLVALGAFLLAYAAKFAESSPPGYWAHKYGVFYSGQYDAMSVGRWMLEKISTYLTYPLNVFSEPAAEEYVRGYPSGFGFIEHAGLGMLACSLALAFWLRHRWDDPRLIPIYLLGGYTVAGAMRIWPLGYFRTNVFLFLYAALALLGCLDSTTRFVRLGAVILVLTPFAIFTLRNPIGEKINHLHTPHYLKTVCESESRTRIPLAADRNAAASARFYLRRDAAIRRECGRRVALRSFRDLRALSKIIGSSSRHESGTWVLVQGTSSLDRDEIRGWLRDNTRVRVDLTSRRMYLLKVSPATRHHQVQSDSVDLQLQETETAIEPNASVSRSGAAAPR